MNEALKKLNLLGYNTDSYLVGLNQFISKEITIIRHECLPVNEVNYYFEEESSAVELADGKILFTEKPSFWYTSFTSDIVIVDDKPVRQWKVSGYDTSFQEWVFDVKAQKLSYSEYSQYCRAMNDETFIELVYAFYNKASRMVSKLDRLPQFVSMLINTEYTDGNLMAEIASTYTDTQIEKFIESIKQCKKLSLPVTDYREVFNFSQS